MAAQKFHWKLLRQLANFKRDSAFSHKCTIADGLFLTDAGTSTGAVRRFRPRHCEFSATKAAMPVMRDADSGPTCG